MSTQAWIFMVGLRIFDLGALAIWLVWFLRLRNDGDGRDDWGSGGGGSGPKRPDGGPRGPRDGLPMPDADPWRGRLRDHADLRRRGGPRRGGGPGRCPTPVRPPAPHRPPRRAPMRQS
jgi:hypothetical protein